MGLQVQLISSQMNTENNGMLKKQTETYMAENE